MNGAYERLDEIRERKGVGSICTKERALYNEGANFLVTLHMDIKL